MLGKIILIVLLVLSLTSSAQEDSLKIELNTVYEKNLDEIIVDAIYDTATVSVSSAKLMGWESTYLNQLKTRNGLKVEYPKIMKVSRRGKDVSCYTSNTKNSSYYVKELKFYNNNNRNLKTISLGHNDYIYKSTSNRYILISKTPTEYDPGYSGGVLYDARGSKVFEIKGPSPVAVSDEGLIIAANLDWQVPYKTGGSFYLYEKNGLLKKEIENPHKQTASASFAKFSPEGKFIIIAFTGTGTEPTYFYLAKSNGEVLGHYAFPEYSIIVASEEIAALDEVGFAVIFDKVYGASSKGLVWEQFICFLDWRGNIKWKQPLEVRGNMVVQISEDKSKVYVITGFGYIWCFYIATGQELWKHKEKWSPDPGSGRCSWEVPRFRELKVKDDILYIIGKQGRSWRSSTLFAFDGKTGNLLKKIEYPQEKITFGETTENISIINISKSSISILK